ncbi:MAG: hypothetical protein LBN06_02935 [Prevotellaceae bacterium]|jgi:hypothetical protein|nr:hypothetical protein [Prevotellaceae bacterium]
MRTTSATRAIIAAALLWATVPSTTKAQDKVEASVGTDIVSNYIWRGIDCGGVSIQPGLSLSYRGLSLAAWGNVGLDSSDTKEVDLTLGYTVGGFNVAMTDYFFFKSGDDTKYFEYAAHSTAHVFEATVGYDFGVLAVSWNTNFAGSDYYNADGKRSYSTYVGVSAPFKLGGLEWGAEVGFTPWEGMYSDGFNLTNITLSATKAVQITDSFALPLFGQLTFNPDANRAYFAFGISF